MAQSLKSYSAEAIDVTWSARRCIHVAECIRGLPQVFDTAKRPWVQPANAPADQVAEVVMRCPSGALHFLRKDGGDEEPVPTETLIWVLGGHALWVRGNVEMDLPGEAEALDETRATLCRCGASGNKPFCDNSHLEIGFDASGELAVNRARTVGALEAGVLRITPLENGPLRLRGSFKLISEDGETVFEGNRALLCRCGGSQAKPFCDNSHEGNGFAAEGF